MGNRNKTRGGESGIRNIMSSMKMILLPVAVCLFFILTSQVTGSPKPKPKPGHFLLQTKDSAADYTIWSGPTERAQEGPGGNARYIDCPNGRRELVFDHVCRAHWCQGEYKYDCEDQCVCDGNCKYDSPCDIPRE